MGINLLGLSGVFKKLLGFNFFGVTGAKVHTKQPRIKYETVSIFFAEIWLQKCKHLVCKSQSKLTCSISIGSYMLNVYIFDVKFLQKNWNSLIFDSRLFGMDFNFMIWNETLYEANIPYSREYKTTYIIRLPRI